MLLPFTREVGTPEVLKKLLVLTAADIAAVGPDVLTKWKESLLIELYFRAMQEVSGDRETGDGHERLKRIAGEIAGQAVLSADRAADEAWVESQLPQFPLRYVYGTPTRRIAAHLAAIRRLHAGEVVVDADFNAPLGYVRICDRDAQ